MTPDVFDVSDVLYSSVPQSELPKGGEVMPAPFRRAERHRPLIADKFSRRQLAIQAIEQSRRHAELEYLKLRSVR